MGGYGLILLRETKMHMEIEKHFKEIKYIFRTDENGKTEEEKVRK